MGTMKLYYAFLFSLALHLLLYFSAKEIASHIETLTKPEVEVVLVDGKDFKVVRQTEGPEPDSDEDTPSHLLSERHQRFKQQQRAEQIGKTVNRAQNAPSGEEQKKQDEMIQKLQAISDLSEQIIQQIQNERNNRPAEEELNPNLFKPGSLPSTVNDPFTNVPIGSFTALNTNRYLYYSYFARIEDQIRNRWVRRIRDVIDSRPSISADKRSRDVWTTEIEVVLDKEGHFVRADVHRSSGLDRFDYAAMDAFREGAPILNPPPGLIEEDGFIRLKYAFNVFWRPSDLYRRQ